jgi:hypothetical protein
MQPPIVPAVKVDVWLGNKDNYEAATLLDLPGLSIELLGHSIGVVSEVTITDLGVVKCKLEF